MADSVNQADLSTWLRRIEGEYREMPGLHLTRQQIQRLWCLDAATCAVIIAALMGSGVLRETPQHKYALAASSHLHRL